MCRRGTSSCRRRTCCSDRARSRPLGGSRAVCCESAGWLTGRPGRTCFIIRRLSLTSLGMLIKVIVWIIPSVMQMIVLTSERSPSTIDSITSSQRTSTSKITWGIIMWTCSKIRWQPGKTNGAIRHRSRNSGLSGSPRAMKFRIFQVWTWVRISILINDFYFQRRRLKTMCNLNLIWVHLIRRTCQ